MLDWSDIDIAVRDAVREFVDKEIRPHVDALESGVSARDLVRYLLLRARHSGSVASVGRLMLVSPT